jgi:hypothetical protein
MSRQQQGLDTAVVLDVRGGKPDEAGQLSNGQQQRQGQGEGLQQAQPEAATGTEPATNGDAVATEDALRHAGHQAEAKAEQGPPGAGVAAAATDLSTATGINRSPADEAAWQFFVRDL